VNCGSRSNFLYIAITVLLYTCLFTFFHTITVYHSIRAILCLQQIGEIDNLIVSWGKVLGCVVCSFHVAAGEEAPTSTTQVFFWRRCAECREASKHQPSEVWLSHTSSINLGITTEGNLLLCSSYLPLGVPSWVPNMHHQLAAVLIIPSS
jgi:hypothetical protein